nr:hypothetical protein [uncultured Campylobacter sp.]
MTRFALAFFKFNAAKRTDKKQFAVRSLQNALKPYQKNGSVDFRFFVNLNAE